MSSSPSKNPTPRPGIAQGTYPERQHPRRGGILKQLDGWLGAISRRKELARARFAVAAVEARGERLVALSDTALQEEAARLRGQLALTGLCDEPRQLLLGVFELGRCRAPAGRKRRDHELVFTLRDCTGVCGVRFVESLSRVVDTRLLLHQAQRPLFCDR